MSRNLYTVAVVSPSLQRELKSILAAGHSAVPLAEQAVLQAVAEPKARVASLRVVLDSWDRAHNLLRAPAMHDLEANGHVWLPSAGPDQTLHPQQEAINARAQEAFVAALDDARIYSRATKGATILLWRTLFMSFDDRDFASA